MTAPISNVPVSGVAASHSADPMATCPVHALREKLRAAGLRPTRQRIALGWLLFGKGHRHVTAERLYEEAADTRIMLSLATVYNSLHQFTEAGLLREIAVDGSKTWFDTNTTRHHHFLIEGANELVDIPGDLVEVSRLPPLPDGLEIVDVDVVVRVRRKA
jgi:Fur family iron response transcriptional regulator